VLGADVVAGCRRLVTGLKYRGLLPRRLALIAALRGEGVTHTALGLAATLASDLDVKVCAVELNWWAPGMERHMVGVEVPAKRRRFGSGGPAAAAAVLTHAEPAFGSGGLAAILTGKATLDQALVATSLQNLQLLPAGALPVEQRPHMARGEALAACLDELQQRYDHLVLDVPAIMVTSDAVAIASLADACCMVVQQGVTSTNLVRQALDEVQHLQLLGVVLNRVQVNTPAWLRGLIPQE
jgi:Mrp family chromosome partitioning ATPase